MDIAAAYPVKTPQRADASVAQRDGGDPHTDGFAAELDEAVAGENAPAKLAQTQSADAQTPGRKADASKQAAVGANTVDPATSQEPNTANTVAAIAMPVLVPPPPAKPMPQATKTTGTVAHHPAAAASMTPAQPAQAASSVETPATAPAIAGAQAPMTDAAAAQTVQPLIEHGAAAKPASTTKKPGDAKAETPATTQASPTPAPQAAPAVPVAQSGSKNATQDNAERKPEGGVQTVQAAHGHAGAPQTHEFKLDASAAAPAMQPTSPTAQNAAPAAPALIAQNAPVFVPPEALGVAIARKALEGVNKFELRLDPPELGRLDVTLEVDDAGNTRAHIRAERPEALELLQREAKGMEQALRQAGLNLDQSSLSFSLGGREGREAQEHQNQGRRAKFNAVLPEDEIHNAAIRGHAPAASGVDLRV
jgi:flagellar hook-length control protein FliK